jgi:hypothetical protein
MNDRAHVRSPRDDFSIPPAASDLEEDERDLLLAERRRKLGRWVALTVGASIVICIAALMRVVAARTDAANDEVVVALPAPPPPVAAAAPPVIDPPAAPPTASVSTPPKAKDKEHRAADAKCAKRLKRGGECPH